MAENKKYSVGIDMGTNSVGWCVLDDDGHIVKKNGKSLWGVRLFNEAEDCSSRRAFRSSRRRLGRRKLRISLLRDLFAKQIAYVDANFYKRLDESKFYLEDKEGINTKSVIFPDGDEKFYEQYPTIFHLRKALIEKDEKADIRLLYLAIHHIVKYRGHFLIEGREFNVDDLSSLKNNYHRINELLGILDKTEYFTNIDSLIETMEKSYKVSSQVTFINKKYTEIYENPTDKYFKLLIDLLSGKKVSVNKFFELEDDENKDSFTIASESIDEVIAGFASQYDENYVEIISCAKAIYDSYILKKILGGSKYISDAMIARYNKHEKDLKTLKKYVRDLDKANGNKELYTKIFKTYDGKENNYSAYVGKSNDIRGSHCSRDEFYKFLRSTLELEKRKKENDPIATCLFDSMANGDLLPKQNSSENGIFPYQLNLIELREILKKQEKFYPFLKEVSDGYTTSQKIESLLTFRIPYYVGPLPSSKADENSRKFAWAVREEGQITPWNFDKKVKLDQSAIKFIERMKNTCSYIEGESCLSKGSLYYSYFTVLQDLNNILVNGKPLSKDEKIDLIKNVYLEKSKVTQKTLSSYLSKKNKVEVSITTSSSGNIDDFDFNGNLKPLQDFIRIFGSIEEVEKNIDLIENIINEITIFEEKSILKRRLETEYHIADEKKRDAICSLSYKKYASFSKKLLLLKGIDENGELLEDGPSILDRMLSTNDNLMVILSSKEIQNEIAFLNAGKTTLDIKDDTSLKNYVDSLYVSPIFKRTLIQTVKILLELERILSGNNTNGKIGDHIKTFFIESTRTNKADKKKTKTRREKIKERYAECKDIALKDAMLKELDSKNDGELLSKKWYLYFLQFGKDIYTGLPITNIEDCDIDHIVPQAKIKDDSFENTVLTLRTINNNKQDTYPLPAGFLTSQAITLITSLKNSKFISETKYEKLMRPASMPLSQNEMKDFAARQLVATSQSVKALGDLLKSQGIQQNSVVYVKADYVHEIRDRYDIYKSRMANNFHHAHDAYLNAIIGRVVSSFYTNQFVNGKINATSWSANLLKPFFTKEEEKVWTNPNGSILFSTSMVKEVKHNIQTRFDIMVTQRVFRKHGGLFDQMLVAKAKNKVPQKGNDDRLASTEKYGGYDKPSYDKFTIEEVRGKKRFVPHDFSFNANTKKVYSTGTIIQRGKCKIIIDGSGGGETRVLISKGFEPFIPWNIYTIISKIEKINEILVLNKLSPQPSFLNDNEYLDKINHIPFFSVSNEKIIRNKSSSALSSITVKEYDTLFDFLFSFFLSNTGLFSLFTAIYPQFKSENLDNIHSLSIINKQNIAIQYLLLISKNNTNVNLELIGEKANVGKCRFSGVLEPGDKIIFESITGFYKKEIEIK